MKCFSRTEAIVRLHKEYKKHGNIETVSPELFSSAVDVICESEFFDRLGVWFLKVDASSVVVGICEDSAKLSSLRHELLPCHVNSFADVAGFVKWNMVWLKLKELNEDAAFDRAQEYHDNMVKP